MSPPSCADLGGLCRQPPGCRGSRAARCPTALCTMSSPSGATPAIGTSLFDAEGPGGAVENVTGAAAGTANAGSDGLFGTSPHLSAMVGAGGLFDSDSGPSQSLLDGPAPAAAAPRRPRGHDGHGGHRPGAPPRCGFPRGDGSRCWTGRRVSGRAGPPRVIRSPGRPSRSLRAARQTGASA